MTSDALDPLIHVRARLQIVATLATLPDGDALSFSRLQDMIGLTPGNLITHLRKLENAAYLSSDKTGDGPASRTSLALTHLGRAAFETYRRNLRELLDGSQPVPGGPRAKETPASSGSTVPTVTPAPVVDVTPSENPSRHQDVDLL